MSGGVTRPRKTCHLDAASAGYRVGYGDASHFTRGAIEVIRPGDRVFFELGEEHWHGAAPNRFLTHIAMQEVDEQGSPVTWGEHVSEEEYGAAPSIDQ